MIFSRAEIQPSDEHFRETNVEGVESARGIMDVNHVIPC
jgi:hypothetical protein